MNDFSARRTMMVDTQVRPSDVTKFPIIAAMLEVPREIYVPQNKRQQAYADANLSLGPSRVMLEPRTFSKLLDALDIGLDALVLDVGCGLGYSTAIIAKLAQAVVAIESDAEMAADAQEMLSQNDVDNAAVIVARLARGLPKHGPYDVIVLQGAVEQVPDAIVAQLKEGGRIGCIFMENALGVVRIGYKINGEISWRFGFNASAQVLPGFEQPEKFAL